jgi:hypothetical protein
MRRIALGLVSALLIGVSASSPTMSQETPAVDPEAAAQCTVDPIDPDAYNAAILESIPPLPASTSPVGEPADDETVSAVTEVIAQSVACTSAGDLGRLLAVIDPSYAPTLLGVPYGDVPAAVEAAAQTSEAAGPATPLVDDVDQGSLVTTLDSVSNVVVLENGQVAAEAVLVREGFPPTTATIYLRMDEAAGRYIIVNYAFHAAEMPVATPAG